jgi:hypothetical protein
LFSLFFIRDFVVVLDLNFSFNQEVLAGYTLNTLVLRLIVGIGPAYVSSGSVIVLLLLARGYHNLYIVGEERRDVTAEAVGLLSHENLYHLHATNNIGSLD